MAKDENQDLNGVAANQAPERSEAAAEFAAPAAVDWSRLSQPQLIWRRFRASRLAVTGGVLTLLFYACAVFGGFVSPYGLHTRFTDHIYCPPMRPHFADAAGNWSLRPFVYGYVQRMDPNTFEITYAADTTVRYPIRFFVPGDAYTVLGTVHGSVHLFGIEQGVPLFLAGSDRQGRDMLSRMILGSQVSLSVGLLGVVFGIGLGSVLGTVSGYYGGLVDDLMQRFSEVLMSIPRVPLWMALAAILPVDWSPIRVYFGITVILALIDWGGLARQLRGRTLALREEVYTLAARSAGASDWWIIRKHLIPNNASHIIVVGTLAIPGMILGETALSFLGLGIRPPMTSWGVLLQEAQNVRTIVLNPWLIIPAALVIAAVLAFNFLGDGLRDAVSPFSK